MIDPSSTLPLTKREQLISNALQGLLANPSVNTGTRAAYDNLVQDAITVADNLISAVNASEMLPVFYNAAATAAEATAVSDAIAAAEAAAQAAATAALQAQTGTEATSETGRAVDDGRALVN